MSIKIENETLLKQLKLKMRYLFLCYTSFKKGGFVMAQIHKQFSTEQVKDLFKRYMDKQIKRDYIQDILGIKKAHFFRLLKEYRGSPDSFSIDYARTSPKRLSPDVKESILKEPQIPLSPPLSLLTKNHYGCALFTFKN